MPLAPISVRLEELGKLQQLREQGALTDEEFEREKAKLLLAEDGNAAPAGRPNIALWVLIGSIAVLVVAAIAAFVVVGGRGSSSPVNTMTSSAVMTNTTAVAEPAAPVPATFTQDQVATAFATIYPHGARETDANGTLEFTPRKLISVQGDLLALVSTGQRDGGANGGACHACVGALRIDYLNWSSGNFDGAQAAAHRFDEPGGGFGEPPAWKIQKASGFPALKVTSASTNQGCTSEASVLLKLTSAGVVRTSQGTKEDCNAASAAPADGS